MMDAENPVENNAEELEMDQGFELGEQEEGEEAHEPQPGKEPEQKESAEPAGQDTGGRETEPVYENPPQPETSGQQPEPEMLGETPENIAGEMEELRKLNPLAAKLAMENSPDGEAIRKRLESYGAEYAQDRAESVLEKREAAFRQAQEQKARIEAHNRMFQETIRKRNPQYFDLISNAARRQEAQEYFGKVFAWIETLPYGEAKKLMETAQRGKDANQICDLVERYEREKGRPDPTGALAVAGRGTPNVGAGIGDKNDMDAGWELNRD